jgi:hypothetical protein
LAEAREEERRKKKPTPTPPQRREYFIEYIHFLFSINFLIP